MRGGAVPSGHSTGVDAAGGQRGGRGGDHCSHTLLPGPGHQRARTVWYAGSSHRTVGGTSDCFKARALLGFRDWGFLVAGSEFRVQDLGFRGLEFRIRRLLGLEEAEAEFRVQG